MDSARSVLLLGASGFFGPALARAFAGRIAARTYASRTLEGGVQFDARSSSVAELVAALPARPSAAIVALGVTRIDDCARDPAGTAAVNVAGVMRVVGELAALGILPVFLSSDAVFDGSRGGWREEDEVRPILEYGRQKLAVERILAGLSSPWLALRLPKLLSAAGEPGCLLTGWLEAIDAGRTIDCATDQVFTPAAADDVAAAIDALLRAGARGLYHVAGPERLSRRALLQALLDAHPRAASARVKECSLRDIPVLEPRPLDTSMDAARLLSRHGIRLRPASEIARLAARAWTKA